MTSVAHKLRAQAIRAVTQEGESPADAADMLCVSCETVTRWLIDAGHAVPLQVEPDAIWAGRWDRVATTDRRKVPLPVRRRALRRIARGESIACVARRMRLPYKTVWVWTKRYPTPASTPRAGVRTKCVS